MSVRTIAFAVALGAGLLAVAPASADPSKPIELTIKDHKFHPSRLEVPAGRIFTLLVRNTDPTPEHFDSRDIRIEKVIRGNSQGLITVRALKPGEYRFVGERNSQSARGVMIAR